MNICTKNNDIINIILEDNTIQYYIFIDIIFRIIYIVYKVCDFV